MCCSKGSVDLVHYLLQCVMLCAVCWERRPAPASRCSGSPGASFPNEVSMKKAVTSVGAGPLVQLHCARIFCSSFCAIRANLAASPLRLRNLAV